MPPNAPNLQTDAIPRGIRERDRATIGEVTLIGYAGLGDPQAECAGGRLLLFGASSPLSPAQLRELGLAALAFSNGNWVGITDVELEQRGQLSLLSEVSRG